MIRVVADTNILVSALMFGGLPGQFLDEAFPSRIQLVTSAILLDELDRKLLEKFRTPEELCRSIRQNLQMRALRRWSPWPSSGTIPTTTVYSNVRSPDARITW